MAFNIDTEGASLNHHNQMQQRVEIVSDPKTQSETQEESDKYRKKFYLISFGLILLALIQIICIIVTINGYNKLSNQQNSNQIQIDNLQHQTDEFIQIQILTKDENNTSKFNPEIFEIKLSEIERKINDTYQHLQLQINQILTNIQNISQDLTLSVRQNLTRTITQLQEQLDSISIDNTNLNNKIDTLQTDFDSKYVTFQNKDNSLQTQIDSLGTDITNDLNSKNTALQTMDSSLQSQINSLSVSISNINSQITVMNSNPTQLTDDIVIGSSWYFYNQNGLIASITLNASGVISGFNDANVQTWRLSAAGILEFYNPSQPPVRSIEFIFNVLGKNGKWNLLGPIYATDIHYLQQI